MLVLPRALTRAYLGQLRQYRSPMPKSINSLGVVAWQQAAYQIGLFPRAGHS